VHYLPSFFIFVSIAGLSPSLQAAPIKPSQNLASDQSVKVRVSFGTHYTFKILGRDLSLSQQGSAVGEVDWKVECGRSSTGEIVAKTQQGHQFSLPLTLQSKTGFLKFNTYLLREKISLIPKKDGGCLVVNTLGLDHYLAGLINREMSPSWPIEALKAQAVASRSYAISRMRESLGKDFDLENSTMDQVYEGAQAETGKSHMAVTQTKNITLNFKQGPLKAYFHANCGGRTELPESVWGDGKVSAFKTVACPFHKKTSNKKTWNVFLSNDQIEHALRKVSGLLPSTFLSLAKVEAGAINPSERVSDLILSDARGNNVIIPATAFRSAIGNMKVKSTSFSLAESNGRVAIRGEGFGHGVGMCQVGAKSMAENGKSFHQILKYYYPLAQLSTLSSIARSL